MFTKTPLLLALCLIVVLTGCGQVQRMSVNPVDLSIDQDGPEARTWLQRNGNESALASNRFSDTKQALVFVERLYLAGAAKVTIPKDAIDASAETINGEFGPYADALVVELPEDPAQADAVFKLCAAELRREGFDVGETEGAKHIFLWWD